MLKVCDKRQYVFKMTVYLMFVMSGYKQEERLNDEYCKAYNNTV